MSLRLPPNFVRMDGPGDEVLADWVGESESIRKRTCTTAEYLLAGRVAALAEALSFVRSLQRQAAPPPAPVLAPGVRVRTTQPNASEYWSAAALAARRWGATGEIKEQVSATREIFTVEHEDGVRAWYEPGELEPI